MRNTRDKSLDESGQLDGEDNGGIAADTIFAPSRQIRWGDRWSGNVANFVQSAAIIAGADSPQVGLFLLGVDAGLELDAKVARQTALFPLAVNVGAELDVVVRNQFTAFALGVASPQTLTVVMAPQSSTFVLDVVTPEIDDVVPPFTDPSGGQRFGVLGSGLSVVTSIQIGGVTCGSFSVIDDSTLVAVSPALATGTYDVTLLVGGTVVATLATSYVSAVVDLFYWVTNTSTVWGNHAGTLPIAPGMAVGKIDDLSPNGNAWYQSTHVTPPLTPVYSGTDNGTLDITVSSLTLLSDVGTQWNTFTVCFFVDGFPAVPPVGSDSEPLFYGANETLVTTAVALAIGRGPQFSGPADRCGIGVENSFGVKSTKWQTIAAGPFDGGDHTLEWRYDGTDAGHTLTVDGVLQAMTSSASANPGTAQGDMLLSIGEDWTGQQVDLGFYGIFVKFGQVLDTMQGAIVSAFIRHQHGFFLPDRDTR